MGGLIEIARGEVGNSDSLVFYKLRVGVCPKWVVSSTDRRNTF